MPSEYTLAFLGPPRITHHRTGEIVLPSRKALALLAFLAVESAGAHRREAILGLLWPELPTAAGRNNLRVTWLHLRRRLQDGTRQPPMLLSNRLELQFNPQNDHQLDVAAFQGLLENCRTHAHTSRRSCASCAQRLADAVDWVRGEFLQGFAISGCPAFDEWSLVMREKLHLQVIAALGDLGSYHERAGSLEHAERYTRRLLEFDSLREGAHRRLMRVLHSSGQRSAALAQYETCHTLLADALDVLPSEQTVILAERIRAEESGLPASKRHNLPALPSYFTGRKRESAGLLERLTAGSGALVTLTGPGGVGKTRLALQVAHQLVSRFTHGVWLVELAQVNDPAALPAAVAAALDLHVEDDRQLSPALNSYLCGKSLLLVLDSCEHLQGACASLVHELRGAAPGLAVLATSHTALGLAGEQVIRLPPLCSPLPAAGEDMTADTALQFEAVEHFANRAEQALPGFTISAANAGHVAQICHSLDGNPLAIELAAAQMKAMPIETLAQRLDQRFRWSLPPSPDVPPRHRSLGALLDWSYQLLSPAQRSLLRRLSIFAGGWTLSAAEAIDEDGEATLDGLAALVSRSLVDFAYDPERRRYRMHATIRQYASQQLLASGEEAEIARRHAQYYAWLVHQAVLNTDQLSLKQRLDQLDREYENLRAALAWAVEHDHALALALAGELGGDLSFWELGGRLAEGQRWLQMVLQRHQAGAPEGHAPALAKAWLAAALLASELTDFEYGQRCATESLAIFKQAGDRPGEVDASLVSAELFLYQGDEDRLRSSLAHGMDLAGELNYQAGLARGEWLSGEVAIRMGDCPQAIDQLLSSIARWRLLDQPHQLAEALNTLAKALIYMQEIAQASHVLDELATLNQALGYPRGVALTMHNLVESAIVTGDYARARILNAESLHIRRKWELRRGYPRVLESFARLAECDQDWSRSVQLFAAAQALREARGSPGNGAGQVDHTHSQAKARSMLGVLRYELEWSKGLALSAEQAIELALC